MRRTMGEQFLARGLGRKNVIGVIEFVADFARHLGLCMLLVAFTASAQPEADADADESPAYFSVLEALGAEPLGTEGPTCLRGLSAPYATLGPKLEAAIQRRADSAELMYKTIEAATTPQGWSTPEGRVASRAAIAELLDAVDEVERLLSMYRNGVHVALEREREKDAAAADLCRSNFEARLKQAEPYKRRLYAVSVVWLRANSSVFAADGAFAEAAGQYGSRERVPRTDPRYLAMRDALVLHRVAEKELERVKAAYADFKETQQETLLQIPKSPASR